MMSLLPVPAPKCGGARHIYDSFLTPQSRTLLVLQFIIDQDACLVVGLIIADSGVSCDQLYSPVLYN